ncbi:MAG: purine-nucleoside phosphorylase [Clostridia bacterium]|nr:purine-nucleoside phosphorylase [Clostridia bacterium]
MNNNQAKPYPTPHIKASPEDFARTVLMPGDPLRAKFIAQNFLKDPVCINEVRGILGYTGEYDGCKLTVFASGMGMPSMGIYAYELYNFFGIERIIRIGTTGALTEKVKVRDIILAMGACTNSNFAAQYELEGNFAPIADFGMLKTAVEETEKLGVRYHIGNILTSDHFYNDNPQNTLKWAKMGVLSTEMESAALYMNAARTGKKALAMYTVSDSLVTGESTNADERQNSFTDMMRIALNTAARLEKNE